MNIQGINPIISAPIQAQAATSASTTGTSGTSGTSGNNSLSVGNLQSTFLNQLVTELQNQDPTQPVDPTEMVSQMVSLNQLDQLISINQTLSSLTAAPTSGTSGTSGTSAQTANKNSQAAATNVTTSPVATPDSVVPQIPYNNTIPGGLTNLYGNVGVPAKYSSSAIPGGR
jgi:flagellar basal-body rod modification protein FlgD